MNQTKNLNRFNKAHKKLKKHWKWIASASALVTAVSVATPLLTGCSLNQSFSFGNFQSYLNPIISNHEMQKVCGMNVNYIYYGTNYQIPNHIYNNSVNETIATDNEVCTLARFGLIRPYNWSDFGIETGVNGTPISNSNMWQTLPQIFTPLAWEAATAYSWLFKYCVYPVTHDKAFLHFNLMQYAIPYFLQNIVFCYRGPVIPQLPPNSSYYQIFRYITEWNNQKQAYVPGHPDNRFINPNEKHPELMMVKSPRTDFDIANIVRQEEYLVNQGGVPISELPNYAINVNSYELPPLPGQTKNAQAKTMIAKNGQVDEYWGMRGLLGMSPQYTPSIGWYTSVLNTISSFFKGFQNDISFNTNSNPIIDSLALKQIMGGFIYNGDSVYTMQGGDYGTYIDNNGAPITPQNIHVVMPVNNLIAMDNIVVNNSDNQQMYNIALKVAYQLGLSGSVLYKNTPYNQPVCSEPANKLNTATDISKTGTVAGQSCYSYLSMSNFNWVDYTPELKTIYAYANNPTASGYFANGVAGPGLSGQLINKSIRALDMHSDDAASFTPAYYHLEMPFNNLGNSNLGAAFVTFMNDV